VRYAFLLSLENGEAADPAVFVSGPRILGAGRQLRRTGRSHWRIASVDPVPLVLAEERWRNDWRKALEVAGGSYAASGLAALDASAIGKLP
jgi:thioesterase domain-containing protein